MADCPHASERRDVSPPLDVCEDCIAAGTTWNTLRQCLTCGRTCCCDSSPERHMSGHHSATGHPLMRPVGIGADWVWCFVDDATIRELDDGRWQTYDPFFETGLWFAERHIAAGASPSPHETFVTPEGFPLGRWFAHVAEREAAGDLEPEEAEALAGLRGPARD